MGYQIPQKTLDRLFSFTGPFEGSIPHLYLDTQGFVTVGIGFLLPTLEAAKKIGMEPPDKIEADWNAVTAAPKARVASFYKQFTSCTLPQDVLKVEFNRRIQEFANYLYPTYDLANYPEDAVVAILDMAYNLGAGALLKKWPKFKAACQARDWQTASTQCVRKGVQGSSDFRGSRLQLCSAPHLPTAV